MYNKLACGIDCSTQSITGVLVDVAKGEIIHEHSVSYTQDARLQHFPLDAETCLLASSDGRAEQPPLLFLSALDALLDDVRPYLGHVQSIGISAQQHGHVYLSDPNVFYALRHPDSAQTSLLQIFRDAFSYPRAPIWMTNNTSVEAEYIREFVGGQQAMLELSGSDSPLRFTGAIIRWFALKHPELYQATARIHLISSLLSSVLCAADCPIDFGNGSGMSLMNYNTRNWADELLHAVAPSPNDESAQLLKAKLPQITAPNAPLGTIAPYFSEKYAIPQDCVISAGSGDNPQSKALVASDLISLGSSFVIMADSQERTAETNAMYDGLARPFVFACRTNGALCWDQIRGSTSEDFENGERALEQSPIGATSLFYQRLAESFPKSPAFEMQGARGSVAHDYPGIIDSSLAILRSYSASFCSGTDILCITGGPTRSLAILRRIAAFWNRPILALPSFGAALGAAMNGLSAWEQSQHESHIVSDVIAALIPLSNVLYADAAEIELAEQYIPRAIQQYQTIIDHS